MVNKIRSKRFDEFLKSTDTLRIYQGNRLIFSSQKDRLVPIVEYIEQYAPHKINVTVYDRVTGNAAALLLKIIKCKAVFSELGSKYAIETLKSAGIKFHFNNTADCIMNDSGEDICPMEKLSLGKSPAEFFDALKERMRSSTG